MRSRSHRRFKCLHLLLIRSDFSHTLQSLWSVTVLPALPAENLRLDRPLLLSRVSRFAPINANCAPLTARTARRLAAPGRAFAFYAPPCASPLRSKAPNLPKGVLPMQQLSKQPAFELGQIVATPGALAALKKAGQKPSEFLTLHINRE